MPSKLYNSAMTFLRSMEGFVPDEMISRRAPDCIQKMAPASLGISDVDWTNQFVRDFYASIERIHTSMTFDVHDSIEDEKNHKIWLWLSSVAYFADPEIPTGGGEYVFMLTFDEKDEKVKRFVQFLDLDRARGETQRINLTKQRQAKQKGTKPEYIVNPDWGHLLRK